MAVCFERILFSAVLAIVAGSKLANSVRLIIVYRAVDDDEYGRLTRFFFLSGL